MMNNKEIISNCENQVEKKTENVYEFYLPQKKNPKPQHIATITGDINDAEQKADDIAAELGIDVEDLIIAVTARYEEVGNNDRS